MTRTLMTAAVWLVLAGPLAAQDASVTEMVARYRDWRGGAAARGAASASIAATRNFVAGWVRLRKKPPSISPPCARQKRAATAGS